MAIESLNHPINLLGGAPNVKGNLDKEYIKILKETCVKLLSKLKVATTKGILE